MDVSQFDFDLPERLIAQTPLAERSESRLLVLRREDGSIRHRRFQDIVEFLQPGDVLVLNDSKVIPARLIGSKADTGAKIELLLLKQLQGDRWETLVKPAKRIKAGTKVVFGQGELVAVAEEEGEAPGGRIFRLEYDGVLMELLNRLGQMPLPPYIKKQLDDPDRYQTVYARHPGSAAAPTAGLHFTPELLNRIEQRGVNIAAITLHVGLGTFRPVTADRVEDHRMHAEYYDVSREAAEAVNKAKANGRRVVAVGTTSCRTLESIADDEGTVYARSGWTDIFIYPGYTFRAVDALITNFHLPKSTLVMLVSAFAGRELTMKSYREAVREEYRFFSFGDAMLII
ncbi:tRNA preQ1(34) S-adenosylmethionine ribosyltransferase-isomerase QueA [Novibacillus thermophilus]|uniref:S-adenosylmethionine:tRNA ribosyltransferase-isomerase n=1 Tax=Novibacillus thermophilus TaxID=1471761 RepID=A0A1U9K590_9BACL|nr:tRNA preQ1(34) S-adenosylmethionine ribosyltransferase-isomerase QueA [Novibacillus thermophilus]AQS55215.1 tRNA preQ1(34) S-adenosylmethionine ribosyltransferase-isomerase QueA [Novibacillus thermophilus]